MKIKSYQSYLFDLDTTLTNTTDLLYQATLYACKKYNGTFVERSKFTALWGVPLPQHIQLFLGPLSETELSPVMEDFIDFQLKNYKKYLSLYPGVYETLAVLKQHDRKLAVVTSRRVGATEMLLKGSNIFDFFDVILGAESVSKHKPDPEPAFKALKALNCNPEDALFIGDNQIDMDTGRNAGIDTALAVWGRENPEKVQPRPTYIVQKMADLLPQDLVSKLPPAKLDCEN